MGLNILFIGIAEISARKNEIFGKNKKQNISSTVKFFCIGKKRNQNVNNDLA
jgi:hypothetical protein